MPLSVDRVKVLQRDMHRGGCGAGTVRSEAYFGSIVKKENGEPSRNNSPFSILYSPSIYPSLSTAILFNASSFAKSTNTL